VQTDAIIPLPELRRDWIGKSEGLPFNDKNLVEYKVDSVIKGATVYKSGELIVFVKFHYENSQKGKF
jgi:hypothetical protein